MSNLRLAAPMIALAIGIAWSSARAQGMDPSMPMNMPMPSTPPAPKATKPAKKPAKQTTVPVTPAASAMDMPGMTNDAMPGMDMSAASQPAAAPTAVVPVPAPSAADRAAAFPPVSPHPMHDHDVQAFTVFDRFETHGSALEWEGSTWIGGDLDRVWLRSEGQRANGRVEYADLEVLYGHSVATWWDVVAGVRHDFRPGSGQDFVAFGLMGRAPGKFEVQATAYAGSAGQTSLRLEAQRGLLLTNRLAYSNAGLPARRSWAFRYAVKFSEMNR